MVNVYGKPNGFSNATSIAPGNFDNSDPGVGSGIDGAVAGQFQAGICAGISSAWIMAFLSGSDDAKDTANFLDYYENVLRFQGTYIANYKENQNISTTTHGADRFINPMTQLGVPAGIRKIKEETPMVVGTPVFPMGEWGCYSVIPGHAIAFGYDTSNYFIMDPNYGLQRYTGGLTFVMDLNYLYDAYRQHYGEVGERVNLFFYAPPMRPRGMAFSE